MSGNRKVCRFFNTSAGCRFGNKCKFSHVKTAVNQGNRRNDRNNQNRSPNNQSNSQNRGRNSNTNNNKRNQQYNQKRNQGGKNRNNNNRSSIPPFTKRGKPPQIPNAPAGYVKLGPYQILRTQHDENRGKVKQDKPNKIFSKKSRQANSRRRLLRDMKDLWKNPLYTVCAAPKRDNIYEWHANLVGEKGTVWFGVVLHAVLKFPDDYPAHPPKVRLSTPIDHSHVHGDGTMCLDMLETWHANPKWGWSSAYSVSSILLQLQNFIFEDEDRYSPLTQRTANRDGDRAMRLKCSCGHDMTKLQPWPWGKYMYEIGTRNKAPKLKRKKNVQSPLPLFNHNNNPFQQQQKKKKKKKKKKEKKNEVMTTTTPNFSGLLKDIPLEVLRWQILPFFYKHELRKFLSVGKRFQKVVSLMISDEKDSLICFHTKRRYLDSEEMILLSKNNKEEEEESKTKKDTHIEAVTTDLEGDYSEPIILGIGVSIKRNPYTNLIDYVDCPCLDYLSYRAYSEMNVRQSVFKQPFEQFLPIYINEHHGKTRAFPLFCKLVQEYTNLSFFHPLEGAEILFKVMNTCIIRIMNATEHVSEVCLIGYFHCFRLLIALCEKVEWLVPAVDDRLTRFIEHEGQRSHAGERNIGNFLQCIPISSKYTFRDILPHLLDEQWDRNVKWMLKKFPELEINNLGKQRRELLSWAGSIIPCQLVLFNDAFNRLVKPPGDERMSLKEIGERLDENYGLIPESVRRDFQTDVFEILKINNFDRFFKKLGMKPKKSVERTLLDSVANSYRKGYHTHSGGVRGQLVAVKRNMNRFRRNGGQQQQQQNNNYNYRRAQQPKTFSPWMDRNDSKANLEVLSEVRKLPDLLPDHTRIMDFSLFGTVFGEERFTFGKEEKKIDDDDEVNQEEEEEEE